jgi:hypothetical protein
VTTEYRGQLMSGTYRSEESEYTQRQIIMISRLIGKNSDADGFVEDDDDVDEDDEDEVV